MLNLKPTFSLSSFTFIKKLFSSSSLSAIRVVLFLSRGDRDLGVAFQTDPGRQAFISSGSKEPRSALESRRVSLGAHWVDSRESSLLRRLERGRETGRWAMPATKGLRGKTRVAATRRDRW